MKKYSDKQIFQKIIKIIKKYNTTNIYSLISIKNEVSAKYNITPFFWYQILTKGSRILLIRILNYIIINRRMMKTLNYYFTNMSKYKKDGTGNEIKERAILDFFAYSYRIFVPILKRYIILNKRKKAKSDKTKK